MVIGFTCQRPNGDSHFAFASLRLQLFLHIHQRHFAAITSFHIPRNMHLCYDVKLATSASKRRANQKSLVGGYICVCVCVCLCISLWLTTSINNQDPMLWGFGTESSLVNQILATTSTINQDPAMWGFWIMSSPSSRFLDLLNTFYIQAIPTLWGFWIMSRLSVVCL